MSSALSGVVKAIRRARSNGPPGVVGPVLRVPYLVVLPRRPRRPLDERVDALQRDPTLLGEQPHQVGLGG